MGNSIACFSPAHASKKLSTNLSRKPSKRSPNSSPFFGFSASTRRTKGSPKKKETLVDDLIIQQQAIEAVLLFQNHQKNNSGSQPFNRSTSVVFPAPGPKNSQAFKKSSSSRQPLGSDTLFQPLELVDKQVWLGCTFFVFLLLFFCEVIHSL